jgi:hypothetical protein
VCVEAGEAWWWVGERVGSCVDKRGGFECVWKRVWLGGVWVVVVGLVWGLGSSGNCSSRGSGFVSAHTR